MPDLDWAHSKPGTSIEGGGSWDFMYDNRDVSRNCGESAYDIGNVEQKYWSIYPMLAVWRPFSMDLHSGFFPGIGANPIDATFLNWAVGYLQYEPSWGPGGWIVFRDAEGECQGNSCYWPGDFSMGIERVSGGVRV